MRSPEVSPSSLDVVIAPVICWQKRGTEKIWQLGKTSTPPHADVAQSVEHRARRYVVGSSPTVCARSSAPAKYKLERASGDRAQEGSRNVYLSGLTASSRHAAVTAGKDRHPPSWRCGRVVIAFCNSRQEQPWVSGTGAHGARRFESSHLHHRRDLLPRSRTERKPAEVVFPVRCTKAAGRIIIIWLAPAMNEETDATDVPAQG